jgi:transcriptional regulator with XRE-family HTH domain
MQSAAPDARSVEAIASRLVATREALGLNQTRLCERAGIATNTYNQWEKAKGRPDLDGAFLLCDAFGLSLDWIYRGDESRLPHDIAMKLRGPPPPRRIAKGGRR